MRKYLFIFGYESPEECKTNQNCGTDFESSNAIWILALSRDVALEIGCDYAERFVAKLFETAQVNSTSPWRDKFAYWIEDDPLHGFSATDLESLTVIEGN